MFTLLVNRARLILSLCFTVLLLSSCTDETAQQQEKAAIHFKSANTYRAQGQFRAALSEYKSALAKAPTTEYAIALAGIYLELNQTQAAIKLLEPLNKSFPDATAQKLAEAYLQRGKFTSALAQLSPQRELSVGTTEQSRALLLIRTHLGLSQYSQATTALGQYNNLFGPDAESELLQLELSIKTKNTALQTESVKTLQKKYPNNSKANLTLGIIALKANQLELAEKHLTSALSELPKTDIMTPEKLQVLTNLSDTLTKRGRFTEAMLYTQLISEAHPDFENSQKDLNEALNQIRLGNLNQAEELLSKLEKNYPGSDRINALLGVVQLQQGNVSEAGLRLEDAVDPELASPQLIKAAAQAQLQLAKPQQAVDLLQEALKKNPDNAQLLTLYGLSSSYVPGLERESELALQKAVALQPENPRLYLALSQLYTRQGKTELALSQLKLAAKQGSEDPAIASSYVQALLKSGKADTADRYLEQLKKDQPNNANAWQLSAAVAQYNKNPVQAEKHLSKALSLEPNNVTTLIAKGRLAQQQQDYKSAQQLYQQAIKISPEQPSATMALIATSIKLKNTDQIVTQLETLAKKSNQSAISALGQYELSRGDLNAASARAQQLNSLPAKLSTFSKVSGTKIQRALARQNIEQKNYDKAIENLQIAMKFSPSNLQILADIAQAQLLNNDADAAENTLTQLRQRQGGIAPANMIEALNTEPENPNKAIQILRNSWQQVQDQPTIALLYKLEKKHQPESAPGTLSLWHNSYPNDPRPMLELALKAQQSGDKQNAIQWYESVLEKSPEQVIALNNLAWIYNETGQSSKAISTAEKAAKFAPQSADVLDTLGWIYFQAKDKRALKILSTAVELAPENTTIKAHFNEAQANL